MARLGRFVLLIPFLIASPVVALVVLLALACCDAAWFLFGSRKPANNTRGNTKAASVVIPNWNGRDLLARFLPSVIDALADNPENEILVVDNGSEDGSAEFVRDAFPQVTLL